MPPLSPTFRFRLDFAHSSNGTTVDPLPGGCYVFLESVTTFSTEAAAASAMTAAFAAGPVPSGVSAGDTLTMAGTQMRVVQTTAANGLPTTLAANSAHMKALIYPGSTSPLGGAAWRLPA